MGLTLPGVNDCDNKNCLCSNKIEIDYKVSIQYMYNLYMCMCMRMYICVCMCGPHMIGTKSSTTLDGSCIVGIISKCGLEIKACHRNYNLMN